MLSILLLCGVDVVVGVDANVDGVDVGGDVGVDDEGTVSSCLDDDLGLTVNESAESSSRRTLSS